jgi:dsDNA-specific endonuclease/ATPase MutS2
MNIRTFISLLVMMSGLLAGSIVHAQPSTGAPQFDPYLPGELNERALYALKTEDISTALILLERAYRLNPNSPDIKSNLEIVRNIDRQKSPIQVTGEVIYLDVSGNAISNAVSEEIPALWANPK